MDRRRRKLCIEDMFLGRVWGLAATLYTNTEYASLGALETEIPEISTLFSVCWCIETPCFVCVFPYVNIVLVFLVINRQTLIDTNSDERG